MLPSTEIHIAYVYQPSYTLPHIYPSIVWATPCKAGPGISLILVYQVALTVVLILNTTDSCTLVPCSCSALSKYAVLDSLGFNCSNRLQ